MTGFGRGTHTSKHWQATVEITTVNRKQADIVILLPRELNELEPAIRKNAQSRISRGRIQISINLQPTAGAAAAIHIDESLARAFRDVFQKLSKIVGHLVEPTAADYLRSPGIIDSNSTTIPSQDAWLVIEPALESAFSALINMREAEGGHLSDDLHARLVTLETHAAAVSVCAHERPSRQRQLLLKRLADSGLDLDPNDDRVIKEIALFADRSDISEEITRLASHIVRFREYLAEEEAPGRSLDFLCQELFREWNTIGSKANDSRISHKVVEAKTELEKIREQVQNIE